MIIDTHIHLNDRKYQDILEEVIKEALENDVERMIVVGYDRSSSIKAVKMASSSDFIYAAVGLHPSDVIKEEDFDLNWLKNLLREPKVIAIGEIGLDYYWNKNNRDLQITYFKKQLEIARNANLPIIIHSRDAAMDTYEILKEHSLPGVLHCFPYSLEMAREFIKLGFYLGIGGVLTFKNSRVLKEVVKEIDIKHLLSETDGPYLTPEPYRGKINRPAYLKYIIDEISEIKKIDSETVLTVLYQNARNLFRI